MRLLLDTHTLLWWLGDAPQLSARARDAIGRVEAEVFVSAATAWEIATKVRIGKLPGGALVIDDFSGHLARERFIELPISVKHARYAGSFDLAHRDPFDRMLLAQSLAEGLTLVTADPVFTGLPGFAPLW